MVMLVRDLLANDLWSRSGFFFHDGLGPSFGALAVVSHVQLFVHSHLTQCFRQHVLF